MPLEKSSSAEAVGHNIQKEIEAGRPRKQAIAIALETQRRAGGGKPYKGHEVEMHKHGNGHMVQDKGH